MREIYEKSGVIPFFRHILNGKQWISVLFMLLISGFTNLTYGNDFTPTLGENSGYILTAKDSFEESNVISVYIYDNVARSTVQKYYQVSLKEDTYGTSGSVSETYQVNLPYEPVTVTVLTDGNAAPRSDNAGGSNIEENHFGNEGNRQNSYIDSNYGNNTLRDVYGGSLKVMNTTDTISGDFVSNYITSPGRGLGGAIYIRKPINTVQGNFIGNYITATERGSGGAIALHAWIGSIGPVKNIIGDFIGNYVTVNTYYASGGAIANENSDTDGGIIYNIKGDFIGNYAEGVTAGAYGGAINNSSRGFLSKVESQFIGNYVKSSTSYAYGGAIRNFGILNSIYNSSFMNNYAQSGGADMVLGGAIYTEGNITFDATDGYTSVFSGNYVQTGNGPKLYEAIYVGSPDGTLTFNATNNGSFIFDDYINGVSGYTIDFTGDETGTVYLYNAIKNGNMSTDTITMNLANNEMVENSVNRLNSDESTKWILDFDVSNQNSDTIVTTETSYGIVTIEDLNIMVGTFDNVTGDFKVQILKTPQDTLQLKLSDNVISKFGANEEQYLGERTTPISYRNDEVTAYTNWDDIFNRYQVEGITEKLYGKLGLAKTDTTNDSIGFQITRIETDDDHEETLIGPVDDTFVLMAESDHPNRTFYTTDSEKVHTVDTEKTEINTSAGTFTIQGAQDGENISTIDLNGNEGLVIDDVTTLNINSTKITNGSTNLITVNNQNARINLNGAYIDGNITGSKTFAMSASGDNLTTLNGDITNVTFTNTGLVQNNGTITGTVTNTNQFTNDGVITGNVSNSGTMTSSATNLKSGIANTGTLNLTGKLSTTVTGAGETVINEELTLADNGNVQGTLNLNDGTLKVSPGTISNNSAGIITGNGNLEIDVNFTGANVVTDTITSGGTNTSVLTITNMNKIGDLREFTYTVLLGTNPNISLELTDDVIEDFRIINETINYTSDEIQETTLWTDEYNHHVITTTTTKDIYVADKTTLTYHTTGTTVNDNTASEGDTLALVNQFDHPTRNFNTDNPEEVYTVTSNLGETAGGTLNINGETDGNGNISTIDMGGNKGFEIVNPTELNITKTKITGTNTIIDVKDTTSVVNIEEHSIIEGTIKNKGTVNTKADSLQGNIENDGTINTTGGNLDVVIIGTGKTNINGDTKISSDIQNDVNLNNNSEIKFSNGGTVSGGTLTVNSGSINLQDGTINQAHLGNLVLNQNVPLKIDVNLKDVICDTITTDSLTTNGNTINITGIRILKPTTARTTSVSPIGDISDPDLKQQLAQAIEYPGGEVVYSPIFKYKTEYDKDTGLITFTRGSEKVHTSYNPSILAGPVAAQIGGYLVMVNSYDEAFRNMDMRMMMTKEERTAWKYANKVAMANASSDLTKNRPVKLGCNSMFTNQPDHNKGLWNRTYTIFERVNLDNGPNVSNVMYGTFFGGDTDFKELKHGWDMQGSFYVAYNGSHQAYAGNDIYQNGGMIGGTAIWYKGNFYTALTANVGGNVAEANTRYGSEDIPMLMAGVASKTGYNIELFDGKFIIQPNYLMSYTFVNTFNFTNSQNLRISSSPLHGINIAPGLKLIGNLKNGWQPYISLRMVWNILDKSDFSVVDLTLPEMSLKPYFQYGFGLQKCWGDRFTGYLQAMLRNGGRNGVALSVGFRWALGK